LNAEEVVNFLKCDDDAEKDYNSRFLTSVKHIDAIYFEKTINMFHDLNDVLVLFYEKMPERNSTHSITKRVYLQKPTTSHHKKTIRIYDTR
jgi:hypothetical protein